MDTPPPMQKAGIGSDFLSHRSEVFRSKLINDFHLLDIIDDKGDKTEAPKFYPADIIDPQTVLENMIKQPNGLVRFQVVHSRHDDGGVTNADRRRNRVKNKFAKFPPIDLWAHYVSKSHFFQNVILLLILINCVVLGVQAEVSNRADASLETLKLVLDIFDYCSLLIFVLEILLKWADQFSSFWKSYWNIFDFFVTFSSVVVELISIASGDFGKRTLETTSSGQLQLVVKNLRTFRVLRSLKLIYRFQKVKVIILSTAKAIKAMVGVSILVFLVFYLYAIIGVTFLKHGYQNLPELNFPNGFTTIWYAILSLFQIFTIDHWLAHYQDATRAAPSNLFGAVYVLSWILVGSFIFRNLFTGIMVNNFQSIREEVMEEIQTIKEDEKRNQDMTEFAEELDKQGNAKKLGTTSGANIGAGAENEEERSIKENVNSEDLKSIRSNIIIKTEKAALDWQYMVEKNMVNIAAEDSKCYWPRDTLFCYFLAMEALMENLEERKLLLNTATEALLHLHDIP